MRRVPFTIAALALVVGAVIAAVWSGGSRTELQSELGLRRETAFVLQLSGPLHDDRSVKDAEGAPDLAVVTADEALTVDAAVSAPGTGIASLSVLVDDRVVAALRRPCPAGRCPARLHHRFASVPVTARGVGEHRVSVVARSARRKDGQATADFDVNVARRPPPTAEAEPVTHRPGERVPASRLSAGDRAVVLRILRRSRGPLRDLIRGSRLRVRFAGTRRSRGAADLVTLLANVQPPLARAHGVVPLLDSRPPGTLSARLSAALLSDVVVDTDLRRSAIVGIEPGPMSTTSSWTTLERRHVVSPADPDDDGPVAKAAVVRPSRAPAFVRLSDRGPAFLNYDGAADFASSSRDWPVSLVFYRHATVTKVKAALRKVGLTRRGESRFLAYRGPGAGIRFDGDSGIKSACDGHGSDLHLRIYAPTPADHFSDPRWGSFVVASAHLDRADGCGVPPKLFGLSELAERRIAARISTRLGWRVRPDSVPLGNAEPMRRDRSSPEHLWLADGLATMVMVP